MMGKKATFWLLAVLFILPALLPAAGSSLTPFRRMVILENGRRKPLDTFARNLLKQFSGQSSLPGQDASAWLARVLFTPAETLDDKLFLIGHPDVPAALGIPGLGRQRYSLAQIRSGMDRLQQLAMQADRLDAPNRSAADNEIMRLYVNTYTYTRLLGACRFTPNPGSAFPVSGAIAAPILAIIPAPAAGAEKWLSPGEVIAAPEFHRPQVIEEIMLLAQAAQAFAEGRDGDFSRAVAAFNRSVQQRLPPNRAGRKIGLEVFYNRADPFFKAQLAYGLALILLLLALLLPGRVFTSLSRLVFFLGFLAHAGGLIARVLIMNRPPVTNLYETFVFVAWAGALLGFILEWIQKNSLGIMAGSVGGLLFLVVAGRYSLEGDTMGMLAAVLDSNLWLATHVVTISVGYAGCLIAGIIGHVYVIHQVVHPDHPHFRQRLSRSIHGILAFGLVFTFIGTVMGGVWADQSWGRFWGWDPKENGALLIILWCAILFHARLAGMIGPLGMAVGAIVSIITVVLAWFGVNLLGVGMHSYGFTSGIAQWLLFFVAAELIFITAALFLLRKKTAPKNSLLNPVEIKKPDRKNR
jgi:ABC-type transport system involved in cytochrome c biogenesis permease subunit